MHPLHPPPRSAPDATFFVCLFVFFFTLVTQRDVNKTEPKSDQTSDQIRDGEFFFQVRAWVGESEY